MSTYKVVAEGNDYKVAVNRIDYKVSLSRTGGQGAASDGTVLGALPVEIANYGDGDLITIQNAKWINVKRETISDGGNF